MSGGATGATATAGTNPQTVKLSASLTSLGGVVTGGTVTFAVVNGGGGTVGTPVAVGVAGGTASADYALPGGTAAGTYTIRAVYSGSSNFAALTDTAQKLTVRSAGGTAPTGTGAPFAVGADAGGSPVVTLTGSDGKTVRQQQVFDSSFTGGGRVTTADLNGDGTPDVIAGTGPGSATRVVVLDGVTGRNLFTTQPFESAFGGGVYVSAGDLTGDGTPDLVVTPDEGDGRVDLVVAAGFGGGPRVAVFDGTTVTARGATPTKLVNDFFVFEQTLRNGVFVAAGDVDGAGKADVVLGGGPGGGPRVLVISGQALLSQGVAATRRTAAASGWR